MKPDLRKLILLHSAIESGRAVTNSDPTYIIHILSPEGMNRKGFFVVRKTLCREGIRVRKVYSLDGAQEYTRLCQRCMNFDRKISGLKYQKLRHEDFIMRPSLTTTLAYQLRKT